MSDDQIPTSEPVQTQAAGEQPAAEGDVLQKVAGAMMTAAEAMKAGSSDARTAAAKVVPATQRAVSKSVYATCYYLSYGVVFPTLLVAGLFPKNNPLYYGFVDGAHAAQDTIENMNARRAALKAAADEARREADALCAAAAPA